MKKKSLVRWGGTIMAVLLATKGRAHQNVVVVGNGEAVDTNKNSALFAKDHDGKKISIYGISSHLDLLEKKTEVCLSFPGISQLKIEDSGEDKGLILLQSSPRNEFAGGGIYSRRDTKNKVALKVDPAIAEKPNTYVKFSNQECYAVVGTDIGITSTGTRKYRKDDGYLEGPEFVYKIKLSDADGKIKELRINFSGSDADRSWPDQKIWQSKDADAKKAERLRVLKTFEKQVSLNRLMQKLNDAGISSIITLPNIPKE